MHPFHKANERCYNKLAGSLGEDNEGREREADKGAEGMMEETREEGREEEGRGLGSRGGRKTEEGKKLNKWLTAAGRE